MPSVDYLDYAMQTDEEIARRAQQRYETMFLSELEAARRNAEGQSGRIRQTIATLDPQYEQRIRDVEGIYAQQKQNISDATTARGFGRSSYATDMLTRADVRMASDIDALTREKAVRIDELNMQIDGLYAQLDETQGRLTIEKQNRIMNAIEDMKAEQARERQSVLKYNNELTLRQAEEQARQEREMREYQLALERMQQDNHWKQQDMEMRQREAAEKQRNLEYQMQMAQLEYELKAQAAQRDAEQWAWKRQQEERAAEMAAQEAAARAAAAAAAAGGSGAGSSGSSGSTGSSGSKSSSGSSGSSGSKSGSGSSGYSGSSGSGASGAGSTASSSSGSRTSGSSGSSGTSTYATPASTAASNAFLYNELRAQLDRLPKQQALAVVQTDPKYKQLGKDYQKLVQYVLNR